MENTTWNQQLELVNVNLNYKLDSIIQILTQLHTKINQLEYQNRLLSQQNNQNQSDSEMEDLQPRKRFCYKDRQIKHLDLRPEEPRKMKRKKVKDLDNDLEDQKDRQRWIEMEQLKYRLQELETQRQIQEIDKHFSYIN